MKVSSPVIVGLVFGLFAFGMANNGSADEPSADEASNESQGDGNGDGDGDGSGGDAGDDDNGDEDDAGESSDSGSSGSDDDFPNTGGVDVSALPSVSADDVVITFTFDDGPDPTYTPQVLDLLAAHGAKAVFCVVGERVREHPDLVRRIVDEGHALCNHTYSHDHDLEERSADGVEQEITGTEEAIADAVPGADAAFFRQPGSHVTPDVEPIAVEQGLTTLDWTVDPRDWDQPGAQTIVERVFGGLAPGAVVLMHDGGGDRSQTVQAVAAMLPAILDAGYDVAVPSTD